MSGLEPSGPSEEACRAAFEHWFCAVDEKGWDSEDEAVREDWRAGMRKAHAIDRLASSPGGERVTQTEGLDAAIDAMLQSEATGGTAGDPRQEMRELLLAALPHIPPSPGGDEVEAVARELREIAGKLVWSEQDHLLTLADRLTSVQRLSSQDRPIASTAPQTERKQDG